MRIVVRPLASPLPLGLCAFAAGVLATSLLELGLVPPAQAREVAVIGLGFSAPLERACASSSSRPSRSGDYGSDPIAPLRAPGSFLVVSARHRGDVAPAPGQPWTPLRVAVLAAGALIVRARAAPSSPRARSCS